MKKFLKTGILYFFSFLLCLTLSINLQAKNVLDESWKNVVYGNCDDQNAGWWSSSEAIRIWGSNTEQETIILSPVSEATPI